LYIAICIWVNYITRKAQASAEKIVFAGTARLKQAAETKHKLSACMHYNPGIRLKWIIMHAHFVFHLSSLFQYSFISVLELK